MSIINHFKAVKQGRHHCVGLSLVHRSAQRPRKLYKHRYACICIAPVCCKPVNRIDATVINMPVIPSSVCRTVQKAVLQHLCSGHQIG